ncbi:MAG TPA: RICIN domain-containing protein [Myxococcaceae bacterium]|nr:RICIN domain-containing protein [Myxococcaceae bacterium]
MKIELKVEVDSAKNIHPAMEIKPAMNLMQATNLRAAGAGGLRRVRIQNVKSKNFLGIEGDEWGSDSLNLAIRELSGLPPRESPQVWILFPFREDNVFWLVNQYSGYLASVNGQSLDNDARVIQYPCEFVAEKPTFQEWEFVQRNGRVLIKNMHSQKFIGPKGRATNDGQLCIQYEDQSGSDNYQEWILADV